MPVLEKQVQQDTLPRTQAARVGQLLGLKGNNRIDDVALANKIAKGLRVSSADALVSFIGRSGVVGPLIPEATLRRARKERKNLSREMSERLYEVSRVIDAVSCAYHGDKDATLHFLTQPHTLLDGKSPLEMAQSSSAGADAVLNLLKRAEYSFAV